ITRPTGTAEGYNIGMVEGSIGDQIKELHIPGVRPRPSAFNIVDAQLIELLGNLNFIFSGKCYLFTLCTIAQGCIEYANFLAHYSAASYCSSIQFVIELCCFLTFVLPCSVISLHITYWLCML